MQDEINENKERIVFDEDVFAFMERDARRYNKAFSEEEEAKHI